MTADNPGLSPSDTGACLGVVASSNAQGQKSLELVRLGAGGELSRLSRLSAPDLPEEIAAPSYVVASPAGSVAYVADENRASPRGHVFAVGVDAREGRLSLLGPVRPSAGKGTVHVSLDTTGKHLLAACFDDGLVQVFPVGTDGLLGPATDTRRVGEQPHAIYQEPSGRAVFVPCLAADKVYQLTFDSRAGTLAPAETPTLDLPAGTGPRHLAFWPRGPLAYLICEKRWQVLTLELDAQNATLSALPGSPPALALPDDAAAKVRAGELSCRASELFVHPSGRLLLLTSRLDGPDKQPVDGYVGALPIDEKGRLGRGRFWKVGKEPRGFSLAPGGRFLVVANQRNDADQLMSFAVDAASGSLTPTARLTLDASPMMLALVSAG